MVLKLFFYSNLIYAFYINYYINFTSNLAGDLVVVVKLGLSIRITNSCASKNGFLNSTDEALAPAILYGPFGYGEEQIPCNKHVYSPPSGLYNVNYALLSINYEDSYLIFIQTSVLSSSAALYYKF